MSDVEICDGCAFVATDYTRADLLGTLRALVPMWATTTEGVPADVLSRRPSPGVWSALEYAAHTRDVVGSIDLLLQLALDGDHPVIDEPAPEPDDMGDPVPPADLDEAVHGLLAAVGAMHDRVTDLDDSGWERAVTWGATRTVEAMVAHAVHDATHHLKYVGRGLHALGAGAPSQRGAVAQINVSDGGVPKSPVEVVDVDRGGVVGDRQADRKHHGRPLQALCLWSTEVIGALQAEGHPIEAGLAGENLTLSGVDWSSIRPGVRMLVGDVTIEVSAWAEPCAKNSGWFVDGDFRRMDHGAHPGWSRCYAWVLEGGTVRVGDDVLVEP